MNAKIKNIISQYETDGDFTYMSLSAGQQSESEEKLGFKIDPLFVEFLKDYGHGGIGGIEILGIGKNKELIFLKETLNLREYGLPQNLLVIENCDEFAYCINSDNGKIILWVCNEIKDAYDTFDEYLFDRFSDAAENI